MYTIKDIAKEAGVSVATVSNVIHGVKGKVAPETVERVKKIMQEHSYVPNLSARSLVNKTSRIVGVINHLIPDSNGDFMADPFHNAVIGGIEHVLRTRGYYMMVHTVENEDELVSLFANWNLSGVIITGVFRDAFYRRIVSSKIPCVFIDSYVTGRSVYNVGLEDFNGGYMATKYLLDKGHKSIVFAGAPIHATGVMHERFAGYCAAHKDCGVVVRDANVYEQQSLATGTELGHTLAGRRDVSAVFATADLLAMGILCGLHEGGRLVPDEISVVGFDDIFLSRMTYPKLTTVHQDIWQRGAFAAQQLLGILQGDPVQKRIIMPVNLVERDSVAEFSKKAKKSTKK